MTVEVNFNLNGAPVRVTVEGDEQLADCLRDRLARTGTVLGCREGVCGSCNVLIDGEVVRSCLTLAAQVEGQDVVTVEGLASEGSLSALQQSFVDEGAVQCGFCTPGLLVTATALLDERPDATREEIVHALSGNLCRCTGYGKVVQAVEAVARRQEN